MTNLFPYDLAPLQTYLGWFGGIGLGPGNVLIFKVSGLILPGANLSGLI